MPRLLNVNNYHYRRGGSDVVYFEHAELLSDAGWESAFFSMHHPNNIQSSWSKYFVDELEFGHAYSAYDKIRMASKVIYSREAQKKVSELIDVFCPDIAHLHCIYHHLSPAILPTLKNAGIPVVLTAHDLKIACPAYKMLNNDGICERCKGGDYFNLIKHRCVKDSLLVSTLVAIEGFLHRYLKSYEDNVDRIVVPSQFFINKFVEWGWDKEKFEYIPNYVDVEKFSPAYLPGDYILYFGRLAPEKGISTLLKAASSAKVKLKIIGTGPLEQELKAEAMQLGGDIEFLGYQSGEALYSEIKKSRATVLPAEWYENAPMSVLESYALGKPVIGSNIGGIPELISNDQTGWTFTSGNHQELSALLVNVFNLGDSRISEMGELARSTVETKFNKRIYLDSMLNLYKDLGVEKSDSGILA